MDEIAAARTALPPDASLALFKKGSFYRSAAIFPTPESRTHGAAAITSAVKRPGETASISSWCPGAALIQPPPSSGGNIPPIHQC